MKFLNVALGIVLAAITLTASAQKSYTEGVISFPTEMRGNPAEVKEYFKADSISVIISFGAGSVKQLFTAKHDYVAVVLDIPVMSIKKAAVATPAEIEEGMASMPNFTFTNTTESKQISGFNCTKVVAKENKSGKTYDVWITKDISVPEIAMPYYYKSIGGFPVQFTMFQQGQEIGVTIKSITGDKAPAGTYSFSKDFEKVNSLAELNPGN
jgi:hypothetical protein